MELQEALTQISVIHSHVVKREEFRGYRTVPIAVTAGIALCAAALQQAWFALSEDFVVFVWFWIAVAGFAASICAADLALRYRAETSRRERRKTLHVVGQFLPAVVVGAVTTLVLMTFEEPVPQLLPGLWAMFYSLGIFASRSSLPRSVGFVAAFYLFAGLQMLSAADQAVVPSPWGMGITFAVGQSALALVLHMNLKRTGHGCEEEIA